MSSKWDISLYPQKVVQKDNSELIAKLKPKEPPKPPKPKKPFNELSKRAQRGIRKHQKAKRKAERLARIKKLPYYKYIHTGVWYRRRERFLEKFPTCLICESTDDLNVHHTIYQRRGNINVFGDEQDHELRTLCAKCHMKLHFYKLEDLLIDDEEECRDEILRLPSVSTHKNTEPVLYGPPDIDVPW